MSVRATQRIVGDVVIATGLPKSPLMIVQSVDEEAKLITTTWFSDNNECQEGLFPASALDRFEPRQAQAPKAKKAPGSAAGSAASGRGRKPAK